MMTFDERRELFFKVNEIAEDAIRVIMNPRDYEPEEVRMNVDVLEVMKNVLEYVKVASTFLD